MYDSQKHDPLCVHIGRSSDRNRGPGLQFWGEGGGANILEV